MKSFLCLFILSAQLDASQWRPNDRFLNAVRTVESSGGRLLNGDGGRSLGDFQLSVAAWEDVSARRKVQGRRVYAYSRNVYDRAINRAYAADYIEIVHDRLQKRLGRAPSFGEIYAAYNMGMSSFADCRFQLRRVNPVTLRKCRQIEQMMQDQSGKS